MIIRKARPKDVPNIIGLALELQKYHHQLDSYFVPAKNVRQAYSTYFKKCVRSNKTCLLVAEIDDRIIGYALGELSLRPPVFKLRKIGFIGDIFVSKKYRRCGIAKKFLDMLFIWFKSKHVEFVEITVHIKNEIGKSAWEKYGFKESVLKMKTKLEI